MAYVCTFFFTVTVMEMKHTQGYLLDTLSPPVVYREGVVAVVEGGREAF